LHTLQQMYIGMSYGIGTIPVNDRSGEGTLGQS